MMKKDADSMTKKVKQVDNALSAAEKDLEDFQVLYPFTFEFLIF